MSDDLGQAVKKLEGEVVRLRRDVALALDRYKRDVDDFVGEVESARRGRELQDESFSYLKFHLQEHEARLHLVEKRGKTHDAD